MAFWSNAQSEAKRNYRFKITINQFDGYGGTGGTTSIWWAKTATLPSYDVSEVEHNHLDNKYYFPGRVSWAEVSMTLVDPLTPDATDMLNDLLERSGYKVPGSAEQAANKATIAKKVAANLGDIQIDVVNGEGTTVESWVLKRPFLKAAKFGDLDYSNDELKQIDLTFRYDWAVCTAGGNQRFNVS
jgi:hypothetical protein